MDLPSDDDGESLEAAPLGKYDADGEPLELPQDDDGGSCPAVGEWRGPYTMDT